MSTDRTVFHWGTRREMYAAMVLQSLLSWDRLRDGSQNYNDVVKLAVTIANALQMKLEEKI